MKTKKELLEYIQTSTSWSVNSKRFNLKLPLYMKSGYDFWNTEIAGFGVLFLRVKDSNIDMRIHQNAREKIENLCPCHVVLVFDKLDNKSINSLIHKHIPFVIPNKQIFLPFALLQMQTSNDKEILKKHQKLSTDADTILIGYLDGEIHNGMIISEIAKLIDRELRATSKALDILETLKYLKIEKNGKSKNALFIPKEEVYDKLNIEVVSPVQYTFYVDQLNIEEYIYSGYSALSKYSTLMDDRIKTIAVHNKVLKSNNLNLLECEQDIAQYKVEVWDRDPSIFSHNNAINELYLLRLMKNIDDERTEYALEEIKNKIQNSLGRTY